MGRSLILRPPSSNSREAVHKVNSSRFEAMKARAAARFEDKTGKAYSRPSEGEIRQRRWLVMNTDLLASEVAYWDGDKVREVYRQHNS